MDAWVAAPADGKTAAVAAAQAVRWAEYGLNALAFSLLGLTLVLAVLMWRRTLRLTKETMMPPPLATAARAEMQTGGPAAR